MAKIILTGYMGSGKTTIATLLAEKLAIPAIDLDEKIEEQEQATIKKIFEERGEIHFRKLEHVLFKELMSGPGNFVLALGGGTPCYANNHELLHGENIVSVYLKASIDTLFNRLYVNKSDRPLLSDTDTEELKEFIAKHLFDRSYYYNQAQYKISVDGKSPEMIVAEIMALLT